MGPSVFVNSSALVQNLRQLIEVSGGKPAFPVIKANAYGHDARQVAKLLRDHFLLSELPIFCISRTSEALKLATLGLPQDLLILSGVDWDWHSQNHGYPRMVWALSDPEDLLEWLRRYRELKHFNRVHIKINTGMNRLGLSLSEVSAFVPELQKAVARGLKIEGVMTHFWNADAGDDHDTRAQNRVFNDAIAVLSAANLMDASTWVHAENSAALRWHLPIPPTGRVAFRPGIHLWGYGLDEEYARHDPLVKKLEPAFAVGAPIRKVQMINPGESLSYGWRYKNTSPVPIRVATVALGYADGIPRELSWDGVGQAKGHLVIGGQLCPIISTISMDMMMVKLPDSLSKLNLAEFAYWIHPDYQNIYVIAQSLRTITYEVLCRVSYRMPRLFIGSMEELP